MLVLDFANVEYMSSLGFQALLRAQRVCKTQVGSFAVAALHSAVKAVFDTANFAAVIRNYESVEKALAEMSYAAHTVYLQQRK